LQFLASGPEASDGFAAFTVDPVTGVVRTKAILTHEERGAYRLAVAASDKGRPAKQSVRLLRVEVLDVNDSRPTFSSASLIFRVSTFLFKLYTIKSEQNYFYQ